MAIRRLSMRMRSWPVTCWPLSDPKAATSSTSPSSVADMASRALTAGIDATQVPEDTPFTKNSVEGGPEGVTLAACAAQAAPRDRRARLRALRRAGWRSFGRGPVRVDRRASARVTCRP